MIMKKRSMAIVLTAAMCLSAVPISGSAKEDIQADLLDWIPTSFDEAIEFENTYGTTHIEGGMICLVFKEYGLGAYSYEVVPTTDTARECFHEIYENKYADFRYEVVIYQPFASGAFEVALNRTYKDVTREDSSYQFYADENGEITETDLFTWLPDCITEYDDFVKQYGTVSVRDNYIVYCAEVNYSTGATLIMEQNGTAEIEKILTSGCSKHEVFVAPGSTSYSVVVYQPVSDGTVDVSWKVGREWELEESLVSEINKKYEIGENGSVITDITDEDTPDDVKGDVNGDGTFSVADIALLGKWLLGRPDIQLANWKVADLCEDGKLDVYDLCLMKRELIGQSQKSYEIPDGYIAVFHGGADDLSSETYIYKIDNGAANHGFEYINVTRSSFNINHTEQVTLIGQGELMWTDEVFQIAEANNAYDYVTIPNDDKFYTIEEFMERFLMD